MQGVIHLPEVVSSMSLLFEFHAHSGKCKGVAQFMNLGAVDGDGVVIFELPESFFRGLCEPCKQRVEEIINRDAPHTVISKGF